ncbi:hypothetical protein TVAGG3_0100550 [Trichomonas vaginalis G3]|uniref:hypothetical protein n=1 Tax=Trichomonas vaginalis (strain ATCC PRA-98 / G3) TaxID=412133 RepID=UPI0021E5722A|nr:hypothetical protein TVAGG3_0863840 [Trichomonas vaginalis G3]XP_051107760.1 hypothetical protein TVAGG3_0100550 [Trichomonas vaginalis G3]KAI5500869.1 hypothetical protein TVAGG3_0863840 [Trichomonas vaginalis G3]KAI5544356.1 hypothetical protein TVAGG3_0100550 [Trichomonas vaginalis G3]
MRSKSILAGAVNVPIEPTSNVDSRTTNNIVIKNYSSECLKEKEPELKSVNLNTASNANATSDVKLEYPPLDQILSREANDNPYTNVQTNPSDNVDHYLLQLYQTILLKDDKKLLTNLISKNQIILTKEDLENVISRITGKQCVIDYLDPEIECCGQTPIFMKIGNIRIIETPGTPGVEFKYKYSNEYTKLSTYYKLCLKYVLVN